MVKTSNFFRTSQKFSKQYKTLKLFQNFVKELCLVVGGGQWGIHGQYSFLFIQYYVYTYTIYIKYTYFMHIFWCFMHKHCIIIHYIQDYFTPKFYVENRLLAKPHIYTSFSLYRANPYQCLYRWSFLAQYTPFLCTPIFGSKHQKKNTPFLVCSLCVLGGHTTLYVSYPLPHLNHSKRQ